MIIFNMLKEQFENPLSQFFQQGIEQCVKYERQKNETYKSKQQKIREKIQKSNDHKKQKRKQRRELQKKKLHQILSPMTLQQKRQYLDNIKQLKQQKKQRVRSAISSGQMIILDLVYEQKMNSKQNKSLASQIELIMKTIKYAEKPPSIHLCNFKAAIKEQLEKMRYQFWALTVHQEDLAVFSQGIQKKLIYLSPDAEQTLDTIDQNDVFILGGLIDRTILKNASLTRAKSLGIQAKRLPINQYMKGRTCLNLDHVISMVCKFKQTGCWKMAFQYAAPKRWKKDQGKNQEDLESQQEKKEGIYEKEEENESENEEQDSSN